MSEATSEAGRRAAPVGEPAQRAPWEPPALPLRRTPRLRVLTQLTGLDPSGGVELCVLQDSLALAQRGHTFDIVHGDRGAGETLRPVYRDAGFGLNGPHEFDFDVRHPLRSFGRYLPSTRWARTRRPDVVWLNRFEHIFWGQAVARWTGAPLVCHLHGVPMFDRPRQLGAGVAHYLAVSEYIRDAWIDRGLPPGRVSVLPNAVPEHAYPFGGDDELVAARRLLGLPLGVPVVLCYGRLIAEKGLRHLLLAWRRVEQRHEGAVLVLVGAPDPRADPAFAQEFAQLEPASYRWFAETLDVRPFLHACDVVAFPSLLEEAFGRVVVEGMSAGRPVVASRIGALPEVLAGPMSRFLVEPGSTVELADRLGDVLDWRRTEPDLGRRCASWVRERFPFESHVDGLEQVLHRNRRRPRRRQRAT